MEIDVNNEDPKYWEKVLSENDLSEERGDPEPIEIPPDLFQDLLAEAEDQASNEDEDVKIRFMPRSFAEEYENINAELRTKFDSNDSFVTGHQIIRKRKPRKGVGKTSKGECPDTIKTNEGVKKFLLSMYPKLNSSISQRCAAGRCARAIYLYYRTDMTHGEIAKELNLSYNRLRRLLQWIRSSAINPYKRGRGRPKNMVQSEPLVGRD